MASDAKDFTIMHYCLKCKFPMTWDKSARLWRCLNCGYLEEENGLAQRFKEARDEYPFNIGRYLNCPQCGGEMTVDFNRESMHCLKCGFCLPVKNLEHIYDEVRCEKCGAFIGTQKGFNLENEFWTCQKCGHKNDLEEETSICSNCGKEFIGYFDTGYDVCSECYEELLAKGEIEEDEVPELTLNVQLVYDDDNNEYEDRELTDEEKFNLDIDRDGLDEDDPYNEFFGSGEYDYLDEKR